MHKDFTDIVAEQLDAIFVGEIEDALLQFVVTHQTDRWLIFSDYVINDKTRPNNVYAYSILPAGIYLDALMQMVKLHAVADLKKSKDLRDGMRSLLNDPRIFSFCFVVEGKGLLPNNDKEVVRMLSETHRAMKNWKDAENHQPLIARFQRLVERASHRSFNRDLLGQISSATIFASYLTYRLCRFARMDRVGWMSDRDKITDAYEQIANDLYTMTVGGYFERYLKSRNVPSLGVNDTLGRNSQRDGSPEEAPREGMWCDHFLRIPDHLAGAVALWDFSARGFAEAARQKHAQILEQAFAENPRIQVVRLRAEHGEGTIKILPTRAVFRRGQPEPL